MLKRNLGWSVVCAVLVATACSGDDAGGPQGGASGDDDSGTSGADAGGTGGSGGGSGTGGTGGDAGPGGAGGTGGTGGEPGDAAVTDAGDDAGDPFEGLMRLPDVSTEKLASCAGAPDMSLCNVVTDPDREYDVCIDGECVSPGCGDVSCNTAGPRFRMPPAWGHHYFERDAGDEPVVVDLVTGLYWQGCFAGNHGDDCQTGTASKLSWEAAFEYCGELAWGGHDDWYLPDVYEWATLYTIDDSAYADVELFPDATFGGYTSVVDVSGDAWSEDNLFNDYGEVESVVRCVRRGFSDAIPAQRLMRFAPDASRPDELIVHDAATHLDWQACEDCEYDGSPEKLVYEDAVRYCEALVWAGFDDYRLPTVKEDLTTDSLRTHQGSTFTAFEPFKHGYLLHQADWGEDPEWVAVLTEQGGLVFPPGMPVAYQTICVRDQD